MFMQSNTVTPGEGKKTQNKLSKRGHVFEMQVAFDILKFSFCLIKLSARLFHMLMNYNLSCNSRTVVQLSIALEHQNANRRKNTQNCSMGSKHQSTKLLNYVSFSCCLCTIILLVPCTYSEKF